MQRHPSQLRKNQAHPLEWVWEPLQEMEGFSLKTMFGAKAAYRHDALQLVFTAKEEPWCGILVGTSREFHESLQKDFPALRPHQVLPKWLYLSEATDDFESTAKKLVKRVLQRDPRIGVVGAKKGPRRPKQDPSDLPFRTPSKEEPIRLLNLGPKSLGWLEDAGITTMRQVQELGALGICERLRQKGRPVSLLLAYAIEGGLQGLAWTELPEEVKATLKEGFRGIAAKPTRDDARGRTAGKRGPR